MIEIVLIVAACICCAFFYLLFMVLFLIRRLHNRWLWSKAMRFVRPILREIYVNDLAEGANLAIQSQPDEIKLERRPDHAWKDPEKVNGLASSLERLGFSDAGIFSINELPDFSIRLMVNESKAAAAAIYEHALAGISMDIVSDYSNGEGITYTTNRDPGLPAHMRPPFNKTTYRPGAGAEALYKEFLSARRPGDYFRLTADNIAGQLEKAWAKDIKWRKKEEAAMLPAEAHAFKEGRPMPDEKDRKGKIRFDLLYGIMGILNFVALVALLFASRAYEPLNTGPLVPALLHALPPMALFAWFFAGSIQTDGPISKVFAWVFMAIIGYPFMLGTVWLGEIYINGVKDTGPASVHSAAVIDKTRTKHKRHRSYYVRVKPWNPGRGSENINVTSSQYAQVEPGKTTARVTTRPGYLGYEWIAGLSFEP